MAQTLTLGAGTVEALRERITEADIAAALVAVRDALVATDVVRGPKDSGAASLNYVEMPNHSVRLAAAKLLLDLKFPKDKTPRNKVTVNFPSAKADAMSETALRAIAERYTAELPSAVPTR